MQNPDKKIKLLFLIGNGALVNSFGGAEKVCCLMANDLNSRGYEIVIVCNDIDSGVPAYPLKEEIRIINLNGTGKKLYRIGGVPRLLRELTHPIQGSRISWSLRHAETERRGRFFAPAMKQVLDREKPDLVLSFFYEDLYLLPFGEHGFDVPVIQMFHGPPSWMLRFPNQHQKNMLQHCAFVQVLLPSFAEEIRRLGVEHVTIIPNAANEYETGVEYRTTKGGQILFLARIGIQKRPHLLLKAFSKIAPKYPLWSLHFYGAGKGRYYDQVLRQKNSLKLDQQIVFHGATDQVEQVMRNSDIFALPSSFEGFPLALCDAMSIGLPCVGYRSAPAVNELICDGENGLLAEEGVDSFAQKLELLINNPELRAKLGSKARLMVKSLKQSAIMNTWEDLFLKINRLSIEK